MGDCRDSKAPNDGVRTARRWINPQLAPLKVTLFLVFGATSALIPYLTIHMQSIGLTVAEVAAVYLALLFTTCLSPPLTGFLIDRFGRYKPVLLSSIVLNLVAHHCIHFVPPRRDTVLPHSYHVTLGQNGTSLHLESNLDQCPHRWTALNASCSDEGVSSLPAYLTPANWTAGTSECGSYNLSTCDLQLLKHEGRTWVEELVPAGREYDRTFWVYLGVRFVATSMLSSTLTITDPIALDMIEQHGGDFGREKLYSSVGMAVFTPLTGLMIDVASRADPDRHTVYTPAFYTYDALLLCSLVSVWLMPIGRKAPSATVLRDLRRLVRLPPVLALLGFLFLLGNFWGFIESYLFVIMTALGAPNYLLGLTYTVGTVASVPLMFLLGRLTRRVGHVNLLALAFLAHAARILGYSWIADPHWCFPIELFEAVSCYFMWVVATTYCATLAPSALVATLIGLAGTVHFCLGKGVGSFVGGLLIARVGLRLAFRYVGYAAAGCGLLYKAVHLLWLHRYDEQGGAPGPTTPPALRELVLRRASIVPKVDQFGSALSFADPKPKQSDTTEEHVPLEKG